MSEVFDVDSKATLFVDEQGRVHGICHLGARWMCDEKEPREAAIAYVRRFAGLLKVPADWLQNMNQLVSYVEPSDRRVEYHLSEEKTSFDSTTLMFTQTVLNIPVWNSGITMTIKHGPYRVIGAAHTGHDRPEVKLPPRETVDRYLRLFALADAERKLSNAAHDRAADADRVLRGRDSDTAPFVRELLKGRQRPDRPPDDDDAHIIRGRLFVYRFHPRARLGNRRKPASKKRADDTVSLSFPTLPPVPKAIKPNRYYVVAEVTFANRALSEHGIFWRALVELQTGAILHLRPLAAGISGLVFHVDPITATGDAKKTDLQPDSVLNPLRTSVVLPNLEGPAGGIQLLRGSRVKIVHREGRPIAAPTQSAGSSFDYNVRTDDFPAVNSYYHAERFFDTFESLGFSVKTYFKNTVFPLAIDHASSDSHAAADGLGGIDHICLTLDDVAVPTNPAGRACDSRAMWHELGGHGTLYEQVRTANFGFAHSAGDSLSAIFHDPTSKAPDRFDLRPWFSANTRRCDRDVAAGWAWDGIHDDGEYESEEILTTTLFRVYLSIGGASAELASRQFASRMMLYLIFRMIGTLATTSNPRTPEAFAKALMETDGLNWTSEGIFGGAYKKVIRWSFEKQGLYQATGTPRPISTPGLPPAVDVYIEDGRGGEYQYQPDHTDTHAIWNRHAADGITTHQAPVPGQTNFAYVKIKNRGTTTANNVRVRGFHSKPSAGLLWPNDFQPMDTAEIAVGPVAANNTQERIVGPFHWTPVANEAGNDCLLMVASATDDPSNIDSFVPGEVIHDWRLVPNDNNIAMRSVPVAGS